MLVSSSPLKPALKRDTSAEQIDKFQDILEHGARGGGKRGEAGNISPIPGDSALFGEILQPQAAKDHPGE